MSDSVNLPFDHQCVQGVAEPCSLRPARCRAFRLHERLEPGNAPGQCSEALRPLIPATTPQLNLNV